uniref:Uncharacterized protein n=1 Tax=Synarthrophyton chejuense TaxID=2485825 RepID=A0A3G3MFL7_9FLOR|nr:hypothetical protein [Synarthrophyton chejuense]AYR05624.1 hypothetical protein [Synarthrophyton chejuense]
MIIKEHNINFYKLHTNSINNKLKNLPKKWQLILLSDGSFTQNLNSITGKKIKINLIRQTLITKHKTNRSVWIQDNSNNKLAFANSYLKYNQKQGYKSLSLRDTPIGKSVINNEIDISKAIHTINYGYNYFTEKKIQTQRPILSRKYTMYYKQKSLTNIKEIFLPNLNNILNQIN